MKITDELFAGSPARIQPLQSGKDASNGGDDEPKRNSSGSIFETIFHDTIDAQNDASKFTNEMRQLQLAGLLADIPRQMVASEIVGLTHGLDQQRLRSRVFSLVEEL